MGRGFRRSTAGVWPGEREFRAHHGSPAGRAAQDKLAAERLHPVLEPDQAGAPVEIGAAAAVVLNRDVQHTAGGRRVHGDPGRGGVLGRVGQCL